MKSRRATSLAFVGALVAALVGMGTTGCMALDPFLYAPTPAAADADMFAGTAIDLRLRREVASDVRTADGIAVNTWLLSHDDADGTPSARHDTWVLYCHGNNRNLGAFARRLEAIWRLGYTLVGFDYRGYGKTRGTPDEAGLYADARAVRAWAERQGAVPARTMLYGYSLGAAVCTQLAIEAPTPLLVLESPFASIDRLSRDSSAIGLPRALLTHARYDNEAKMAAHRGDLLVYHGDNDDYLRPAYGRILAEAAKGHARTVTFDLVPGADHETVPCIDKRAPRPNPGNCAEGFDPNYLRLLAEAVDAGVEAGLP